jgi:hypothetical protein
MYCCALLMIMDNFPRRGDHRGCSGSSMQGRRRTTDGTDRRGRIIKMVKDVVL